MRGHFKGGDFQMNLEEGLTSQGAATRAYDKYGKRYWKSNVRKDMSLKDSSMSAPSVDGKTEAISGATPRDMSNVGL